LVVTGSNDQLSLIEDVKELVETLKNNNLVEHIELEGGHSFPFI
jgi:hypothetical protein